MAKAKGSSHRSSAGQPSNRAPQAKTGGKLPPQEWDFSSVAAAHLCACFEWEYCRTIPGYREAVTRYRAARQEFYRDGNQFTFRSDTVGLCDEPPHYPYPEWPDTPFCALSDDLRESFACRLMPNTPGRQPLADTRFDDGSTLVDRIVTSHESCGWPIPIATYDQDGKVAPEETRAWALFKIRWWLSPEKLKEQFDHWLKCRPKKVAIIEERGAGGDKRTLMLLLKQLAAYRLLREMTWKEAYKYTLDMRATEQTPSKRKPLYGKFSRLWIEAAAEAERRITVMAAERLVL